jgi:hypothetical protein
MKESKIEKIFLAVISITFFIGIWHGYPFTNVVADEMYFSGSVLRAIEHHSVLPLPQDVPYGTITFYLSYIFISIGLGVMSVLYMFNMDALRLFIIQNPFIVYGIARLVSFCLAIFSLFGLQYVLKRYVSDYRTRLSLIVLLFSNILVSIIFHTSKVWVLSTVLEMSSFYFLVRVFDEPDSRGVTRDIWLSVVLAFFAFANFPLMGMSLVVLPILLYKFWHHPKQKQTLIKSTLLGGFLFCIFTLSNFSGVKAQVMSIVYDYTLSPNALMYNASVALSAYLHLKKILVMFPLLLGLLLYASFTTKAKHKNLFMLSSFYLVLYVAILIGVDRWSLVDKAALRYSFPIPFFITFIIASFDIKWKKVLLIFPLISVIYLIPTLYYLSVDTTSHEAVQYIRENLADDGKVVIFNKVGADTPIPQNKLSYELFKTDQCGSLCRATIQYDLESDFKPITVLDSHSNIEELNKTMRGATKYFVLRSVNPNPDLVLVASFTAQVEDLNYYSADNSGSYIDQVYFRLGRFGPNIYVYKDLNKI